MRGGTLGIVRTPYTESLLRLQTRKLAMDLSSVLKQLERGSSPENPQFVVVIDPVRPRGGGQP